MSSLAFSTLFKEEYLDRLLIRNEEFRKLFLNMNKFLSENYRYLELFFKSLQKISFSLEDYLKKFGVGVGDKNCYFLAKTFSNSLSTFGDDSSRLFHSLSSDISSTLSGIQDKISMNRRNHLDLLSLTLSSYNSLETEYLKILAKYKSFSREADDSLINYHESLKEAKTIYNLSIMNRNLSKVQKIVNKTMILESNLKTAISRLNSKRRELSGIIIETLANFKTCYKLCLGKFYELSKKNFDALSSFLSLFSQMLQQKTEMIQKLENPENLIPNPEDFKYASSPIDTELLTDPISKDKGNNKEKMDIKKQNSMIHNPSKWPDFLENPEKVTDIHVLDFSDWVQNYVDKFYRICNERRKILKHIKIGVKEMADEHETISKSLLKSTKNTPVTASWNTFGEQLFAISQLFAQIFDTMIKKMFGFSNFTQIKVGVFESILMDIDRGVKISSSTAMQALKDHMNVRSSLLKNQASKNNNKKNQTDLMSSGRKSINETAQNVKSIVEELNKEEQKRISFFKDNMIMIFSQMEYYFQEAFEFLQKHNQKLFQDADGNFNEESDSLFFKLINSDSKLNDLFKTKYKEVLLIEKEKDIEFHREFDPESNPLYLKLNGNDKNNITPNMSNPINNNNDPSELEPKNRESITRRESQGKLDLQKSNQSQEILNIKGDLQIVKPEDPVISQRSNENLDRVDSEKKGSLSNFDSPMLLRRRKSLESNEAISPGLEESPGLIKPVKCEKNDEIAEGSKIDAMSDYDKKSQFNNNFDLNNSKKKKSTYSFFRNKFGLTQGEVIDAVFSCALSDKMLVQGKMFISNKKIGFHSYFNKHTFIGETKMIIPKNDIIRIEKRYNALIFDNSIAIVTPRGELFFTSFVFRDKAYVSIIKMIKPPEQRDLAAILESARNISILKNSNDNMNNLEEKKEISPFNSPTNNANNNDANVVAAAEVIVDQALLKKLENRAIMVREIAPKDDFFNDQEFKMKAPGFIQRVEDVYRILFSNDTIRFKGKDYHGFWEYLKVVKSEDIEYSMSPLNPPPPVFYSKSENLEELASYPNFSERKVEFTHPVRNTGIPFMPKTCPVKDFQKIYWISNTEFKMVGDVKSEKIPYADCFYISVIYTVRQCEDKSIDIICKFKVVWIKSTVLKGTIEKKVNSETIETTTTVILPSFMEFLKYVYLSNEYQSKYVPKKADAPAVQAELPVAQNANEERNEEMMNKIDDSKKEIEKLKNQVKRNQIILMVLGGIYLFHVFYHIFCYLFT